MILFCDIKSIMRISLVTGGSSGIGRGITERFLEEGYFVYVVGRSAENIDKCKSEINSKNVSYFQGDISSEDFVFKLCDEIESRHGKLDVLVNSAGVFRGGGGVHEPISRWRETLEINLVAQFSVIQKCYELLRKGDSPSIINISSVCSLGPYSTCSSTSYSASKAGLDMLTQRLAKELAPDKIRVNSINPGIVSSNIWKGAGVSLEQHLSWLDGVKDRRCLLGRVGMPRDVASLALFLSSKESEWMTGSIIPLDGGYSVSQ